MCKVASVCVLDVSFPGKQSALPVESVAANGCTSAIRQSIRTASVRDIHTGSEQGIHHVKIGLRRYCSEVLTSS